LGKKNDKRINDITVISKYLLMQKSNLILKNLAELTGYRWPKNHTGYIVIPTILPFSPFTNNVFFFSIFNYLKSPAKQKNILFVSAHEISHIIFFDLIKKIYGNHLPLNKTSTHFLKEILAPVIMNQQKLSKYLKLKNYLGNPFLRDIVVFYKNKEFQITEFFQKIYEVGIKKNLNFNEILKIMVTLMRLIQKEISAKNNMWNKYGNNIFKNKTVFKIYRKSIKLKAPKLKELSTLFDD
jgi:hypothetical protein